MGKKADARNAVIFEAKVRELLREGMSAAKIAKETGKSYQHTKLIVDRVLSEPPHAD